MSLIRGSRVGRPRRLAGRGVERHRPGTASTAASRRRAGHRLGTQRDGWRVRGLAPGQRRHPGRRHRPRRGGSLRRRRILEDGPDRSRSYCAGHYRAMRATAFDLDDALRHNQVNYVGALHLLDAVLPPLIVAEGRPCQPGLERGRLSRAAELARLRADQGGADQPRRDALARPRAARHRRLGGQSGLRRDAAHVGQRLHDAGR